MTAVDLVITDDNPAFEMWRRCFPRSSYERYWAVFRDENVGLTMDERVQSIVDAAKARWDVCKRWTWAVPSPEALALIAFHAGRHGIVEVGAGLGYWAALLAARGVDVIASDAYGTPRDHYFSPGAESFHPVVKASAAEFAAIHAHRTLLVVWPPYGEPMGADAVEAYWLAGGRKVIYVGEGLGGCCGDDRMFALLGDEYEEEQSCAARFRQVHWEAVPQWEGIHDALSIHERIDYQELTP